MKKQIFAVITNLNGLTTTEKRVLDQMGCEVNKVYNVKEVILDGDSYKAICDLNTVEITFDSDNVRLYQTYGDDIKLYNPLQDSELQKPKQQGE